MDYVFFKPSMVSYFRSITGRLRGNVMLLHVKVYDDWDETLPNTYSIYVETCGPEGINYGDAGSGIHYTYALTLNDVTVCVEDIPEGWTVEPEQLFVHKDLVLEQYAGMFNLKTETQTVNRPSCKIWLIQDGVRMTPYIKIPQVGNYRDGPRWNPADLQAPVNASSQPTDRLGIKLHIFRNFLAKLSDQYLGNNYRWLRFLLYDHLPIAVLSKTDISGMDLFNELISRGHISSTNVTILSDIARVTGLVAAKQCVKAYKQETECKEGNGLTFFRKILFKGLMEVADTEVHGLVAYFNLSHYNFDNVWDLVFRLENHKKLDNKQKWIAFADCVNEQAKSIIIDAVSWLSTGGRRSTSPDTPKWNPAENAVPSESEIAEAFNKALKEKKAEVNQGRLIVMGLERVGKTSTIKSFLRKEFDPNEPFTDAIAANKTYIQNSPDVWNEAPEDLCPFTLTYEGNVSELVKKDLKQRKVPKPRLLLLSPSTSSASKEKIPEVIVIEAKAFDVNKDETQSECIMSKNAFIMNIWDFGGQPIYSVIQRMLFSSFAVVCVVFNFEHDLNRRARVRDPTTGEYYDHRMTYLDFIICCVRSVYMNGTHFELEGEQILGTPVLLLGTHCNSLKLGKTEDERKSKIREISSEIWNALRKKPYGKMVSKIFPIENSESFDKSGAADAMKEIFTLTKKMVKPQPLKWMLLLKEIQKLRKEHFCQDTSEIIKLIEQCGIEEADQHFVLQYLHNIGEIFYYPNDDALEDIIVIDIMQVVRLSIAIITVIEPDLQAPMLRDSWEKLNTGILEKPLLIHVWEKLGVKDEQVDFFASLLQRFGLICKKDVTEGQDQEFFVLSRLKPVPVELPLTKYDEERAISFFHDFSNYLPDDIFQRGATKFIGKFQMKDPKATLRYEHVGLNIDKKHYVILNVVTIKQRRMFKTTILRIIVRKTHATSEPIVTHLPEKDDPERDVCRKVLNFIQEELSSLRPTDDKGVELKTYILGTCCGSFHNVSDFNSDVLPCGMEGMDITRYRRLLGDDNQPELAGVSDLPTHTVEKVKEPGAKYARLSEEASSSTRASQLQYPTGHTAQPPTLSGFTTSASQPQFPTGFTGQSSSLSGFTASGVIEDQYSLMLYRVSDELGKRNVCIDQLKFALFDFILNKVNLQNAQSPFKIFSELRKTRNPPDVINILIALFKLLWLDALNDIFFQSGFPITDIQPMNVFSPFRISIVNMINHLQNSKINMIAGVSAVPQDECVNQWKLLQYLQDKGKLHEGNLMQFVEQFGINKDTLKWHPAKPHVVPTEASQPQFPTGQPSVLSGFTASATQPHFPTGHTGQPSVFYGFTATALPSVFPTGHGIQAAPVPVCMGQRGDAGPPSSSTEMSSVVLEDSTERTKLQDDRFRKFLLELSQQYDGLNYKWVRFLLYEHLPIGVLSKNDINAMTLFNKLNAEGHISCTNIILLSEIVEITQLVLAKSCIARYKRTTPCKKGRVLSQYRETLFRALREVADSELPTLIPGYQLDNFQHKFNDIWDLVFDLEQAKYLDAKRQDRWIDFANLLNETAKEIMISNMSRVFE